ncbi:DUF559 domain-containing protein [Klebsiella quasipneumoniae]
MRRHLTPQERRLWHQLRDRRFASYKFHRQASRRTLYSRFCLVIELAGGQHDNRTEYDARRTTWLKQQGWTVLRFWNIEYDRNETGVLQVILRTHEELSPSPRPSPSGRGLG